MSFNPDAPIDGRAEGDLLGRSPFCAAMASQLILDQGSNGIVISLEGPWGSGKSSIINLIEHHLRETTESVPIVVRFNPWMVGSLSTLVEEFFKELRGSVDFFYRDKFVAGAKELIGKLDSYSKLLSITKLIPGAEPWVTLLGSVLGGARETTKALAEKSVAKQKKEICESIVSLGKSFIVFIDDLDRLPPEEVFAIVRLVKAVSDFPQVAYVIAFDPGYVASALEKAGIQNGREYLDKIIQVRVSVPRISTRDIEAIVNYEAGSLKIEESLAQFAGERNRVGELFSTSIKYLLSTPRDVHRLFNRLKVLQPLVSKEIGFGDLLALETIAITAPGLYDHIRTSPHAYTGSLEDGWDLMDEPKKRIKSLEPERLAAIESAAPEKRPFLIELVRRLFPLVSLNVSTERRSLSRTSGRIANAENLRIVFSATLREDQVSLGLVRSFIDDPSERISIISVAANEEMLDNFLNLLHLALGDISVVVDQPHDLIRHLGRIAESKIVRKLDLKNGLEILKVRPSFPLVWIVKSVLKRTGADPGAELESLVKDPALFALSTPLVYGLCEAHGLLGEKPTDPTANEFGPAKAIERLAHRWARTATEFFRSGDGLASNEAGSALRLLRILDEAAARVVVANALESPESCDRLARAIGYGSLDSFKGHFAKIEDSVLDRFGSREKFQLVAAARLLEPTLEGDLRAIYSSMLDGGQYYFSDYGWQP